MFAEGYQYGEFVVVNQKFVKKELEPPVGTIKLSKIPKDVRKKYGIKKGQRTPWSNRKIV